MAPRGVAFLDRSCLPLLALLLPCAGLAAQTGSIDPTRASLADLKTYVPAQIELIEESAVDLRPWLPPVGEQRLNDCTAWAIGYAAKSYLEARDQGWLPDADERVFSPSFLYNQINGGRDEGSSFIDALRVMRELGAATLATQPYRPDDHRAAPSARALAEARAFPLHDAQLLPDRAAIRRALQRRQIVVFGAHVNPIFLSGRFATYDRGTFVRDETLRQPGQRHGKHAMCIVGYDDRRHAFLVQNSWGTKWNQGGYAFVHDELFDDIRLAGESEGVFCNWAITLLDVEEKLERGPDGLPRPLPTDLATIAVRGFCDAVDFDPQQQRYVYTFVADLRGQQAALDAVTRVTWTWTDEQGKPRQASSTARGSAFGIVGMTNQNPLDLRVEFQATDQPDSRLLLASIRGPVPKAEFRSAAIRFEDQYWGRLDRDGSTPLFEWRTRLDVPLQDQDEIREVRWQVGKLNRLEPVQVCTGNNGPAWEQGAGGLVNETDRIVAEIRYRDGGVKTLEHTPVFTDVVRDEPVIESEVRALGKGQDGRTRYAFTLSVDVPRRERLAIDHVAWELDPWLVPSRRTENQGSFAWATSGTSDREFRATATLVRNDGTRQRLERWIELGADARYADADRLALSAHDVYLGRVDGVPAWRTTFRVVGDRESLRAIREARFTTEYAGRPGTWTVPPGTAGEGLQLTIDSRGPRTLTAVLAREGGDKRLELTHAPSAPLDDQLGIAIEQAEQTDLTLPREDGPPRSAKSLSAAIRAPLRERLRIRSVEWRHVVHGRVERTLRPAEWLSWPALTDLATVITDRSTIEAVVTSMDGFVEHVTVPVSPAGLQTKREPLTLRVREKYEGGHETAKSWRVRLALAGLAEAVAEVESLDLKLLDPYGEDLGPRELSGSRETCFDVIVHEPTDVLVIAKRRDGSQARFRVRVHAEAPELAELAVHTANQPYPSPAQPQRVCWIEGREGSFGAIARVRWLAADGAELAVVARNELGDLCGFPLVREAGAALPAVAEAVLADGTTHRLPVPAPPTPGELRWRAVQRPFADGRVELELALDGDPAQLARLARETRFELVVDGVARGGEELLAFARPARRFLLPRGRYEFAGVRYGFGDGTIQALAGGTLDVDVPSRGPLAIAVERCFAEPASPTATAFSIRLQGDEDLLARVRAVEYRVGGSSAVRIARRFGGAHDGFELRRNLSRAVPVRATVHFASGETQRLEFTPPPR